jgi:hypothetical protein
MSVTTAHSTQSLSSSGTVRRRKARNRAAALRRRVQRRRFLAAQRAYERRDLTDAYIDRHGRMQLDASTLVAFAQR